MIPDKSVVNIGQSAFQGCTSLKQINIPLSVQKIEPDAFLGCDNITCGVSHDNKTTEYKDRVPEKSCIHLHTDSLDMEFYGRIYCIYGIEHANLL